MLDFRSDTVTTPTQAMRTAMANAVVGDDVYGDDPTVNALELFAAEMFGYEKAMFTTSGVQANLIALMSHCQRGEEYICGQQAHNYKYEGGGAAVLGSIQPQPLLNQADGTIALKDIKAAIKPDDIHFAQTRLLSLENTIGGKILPFEYLAQAEQVAREHGLSTHLDGARLMNAVVGSGRSVQELTQPFDSVSICLSKGLCAPVGSLLLGSEAFIHRARRIRKLLGGGMRQAGILAAAGHLALTEQVERLAEDHANAQMLAEGLGRFDEIKVTSQATNMVFADLGDIDPDAFATFLAEQGILVTATYSTRFVLHKDVNGEAVSRLLQAIEAFLRQA